VADDDRIDWGWTVERAEAHVGKVSIQLTRPIDSEGRPTPPGFTPSCATCRMSRVFGYETVVKLQLLITVLAKIRKTMWREGGI